MEQKGKIIDIEKWERKNHYLFLKEYDNPFFNITTNIDVSSLYKFVKKHNLSFFIASLFLSIKAANNIKELKYRIVNDNVFLFDSIYAGSAVLNKDNSFSFCYFDYFESFKKFETNAEKVLINNEKTGPTLTTRASELNQIHYTVIPWISFTGMSHARKFDKSDSVPKIVFGKYFEQNNNLLMPVSLEAHHSFVDGFHAGEYFTLFENYCKNPEDSLKR